MTDRIFLVLLLMGIGSRCSSEELSQWTTDELVAAGIERGYDFQNSAFTLFDEVIRREPESPRGYFLKASGFFWRSFVNPADERARSQFRDLSETAIAKAEKRLPRLDYRIGETLVDLPDSERALVAFNKVLATVDEEDRTLISWTYYQIGRSYQLQGREHEAAAAFETALLSADDELAEMIANAMGN